MKSPKCNRTRHVTAAATGIAIAGVLGVSGAFAKPKLETGPDAEVTHDGLHRVDKTTMDAAW